MQFMQAVMAETIALLIIVQPQAADETAPRRLGRRAERHPRATGRGRHQLPEQAKQLYHDREEVTVFLVRTKC